MADAASGRWIQKMAAADIADEGVPVTLPNATVVQAMQLFDLREIMKFISEDGALMARGKVVCVFVFAGTMLNVINKNDRVKCNNKTWVCQEIYPSWLGGVCTQLAVAAYPPGG